MLTFKEFRRDVCHTGIMNRVQAKQEYKVYKDAYEVCNPPLVVDLGNCPKATTGWTHHYYDDVIPCQKEEGNNPMFNTTKAMAVSPSNGALAISINATTDERKSDEMSQREYLLSELRQTTRYEWQDSKVTELRKLFNLCVDLYPKTSQALLDAFKNGKFTVDQAKVDKNTKFYSDDRDEDDEEYDGHADRRFYGITFTDLPVMDRDGYNKAMTEYRKAIKDTERLIHISSPADGLKALLALETWLPSNAPVTIH